MKRILLFVLVASIAFAGCNKNQRAVNKLSDGEWEVLTFKENGQDVFYEFDSWEGTATFEECKQRKEGPCSGELVFKAQLTDNQGGVTVTANADVNVDFDYEVEEKGSLIRVEIKATEITVSAMAFGFPLGSQTETEVCQSDCTSRGDINDDYTRITIADGFTEMTLRKI